MSTITKVWTEERFRKALANIDAKTGLGASKLKIKTGKAKSSLGTFSYGSKGEYFTFSLLYFNDPNFPESEAIEVIRHEYSHYMVHKLDWVKKFGDGKNSKHGKAWKYACKLVGSTGRRTYNKKESLPDLDELTAAKMFMAEDIKPINLTDSDSFGRVAVNNDLTERRKRLLKARFGEKHFFEKGDKVMSKKHGVGVVELCDYLSHKEEMWVRYQNGQTFKEDTYSVEKIDL